MINQAPIQLADRAQPQMLLEALLPVDALFVLKLDHLAEAFCVLLLPI